MKNKIKINFIIDILMMLTMMTIAGIGFLMEWVLIPGSQRWEKYGKDVDLYYLGLDRHSWGEITD